MVLAAASKVLARQDDVVMAIVDFQIVASFSSQNRDDGLSSYRTVSAHRMLPAQVASEVIGVRQRFLQ